MSKIYINPPVPFKISVNLKDEKKFTIKGRPLQGVKRFNLNFQKRLYSDAENVAFHFDVRFNYGSGCPYIVTNYKKRGEWKTETRIFNFPFSEKEQFTIDVLVDNDMFTVDLNGQEITMFRHQLPIQLVDAFTVEGEVFLSEVQVS